EAAACGEWAGFDSAVLLSFAGAAVTSFAGAGAAADPRADLKAELVFCAGTATAAIFAASFLTASFLMAPGEADCRASTAGSAAILIWVLAAGAGTTAGLSSTFAGAAMAGIAAGIVAGSGTSNSGSSVWVGVAAIGAAPRLAGWNELPVDAAAVLAGIAGAAALAALALAASEFFRKSPRATRSVPFACSTLIGLVSTR